jgi:hypothetical protein
MKLFVAINKQGLNGYTNLILANQAIDFNNLNNVCEQAECTDLILDEILEYIPIQNVIDVLTQFITRLRKNGRFTIVGIDINDTLKAYHNGQLSIADLNAMIFGTEKIHKCSAFSYTDLEPILTSKGLQIISIDLLGSKFILTAKRI